MTNRELNINQPVKGLNTDLHESNLDSSNAYTFALNARQESEDGNQIYLSNESSNTLSVIFPEGYKVIGRKTIEDNETVFFLVNPETGKSEIGIVINNFGNCQDNIDGIDFNPDDCVECKKNNKFSVKTGESLKLSTVPCQEYKTVINADCLEFSIDHPIHSIEYKITNKTKEIYWTDYNKEMRWLDLLNVPLLPNGSLDCNKIKIFPDFTVPVITPISTQDSGNLETGAYQFFVAYSNAQGEELSQYYSATNPVSIWDNQRTEDLSYRTNKSISIEISNIDTLHKYINIAVSKTIDNTTTFELIGIFDITSSVFRYLYTGYDKVPIPLTSQDIFFKYPFYSKAGTVESQNSILLWGNMLSAEQVNYQSIANNIVLQWESYQVPYSEFESYKEGVNTSLYKGYLRDEVYSFEFVPILKSGELGPKTHIPGPELSDYANQIINNRDSQGFLEDPCDEPQPVRRWEIYNTATNEGYCEEYEDDECYIGPYQYGNMGHYVSTELYPDNEKVWGSLANTPIRHHKMPSVDISPIYNPNSNSQNLNFQHNIYPLGVRVNYNNILDAIKKSDLTQQQKDNIIGFQISRSTRSNNQSIVAKGLLYNVGTAERENETFLFPNYPYNDLRKDPFLSYKEPKDHSGNNAGGFIYEKVEDNIGFNNQSLSYSFITQTIEVDEGEDDGDDESYGVLQPLNINGNVVNLQFSFYSRYENPDEGPKQYWIEFTSPPDAPDNGPEVLSTIYVTGNKEYLFIKFPIRIKRSARDVYTYLGTFFKISGNTVYYDPEEVLDDSLNEINVPILLGGEYHNAQFGILEYFKAANHNTSKVNKQFEIPYGVVHYKVVSRPSPDGDIRLEAFKESSKNRFTFHSPNTSFLKPSLGSFINVESIQYGKSKGTIVKVEDEAKQAIPTKTVFQLAVSMGISTIIRTNLGAGTFGWPTMSFSVDSFVPTLFQALDMFEKLVPLEHYGYQNLSIGHYNNYKFPQEGNKIRNIDLSGYLSPGVLSIGDTNPINNYQRESSVYLRTADSLPFPNEYSGVPVDNSRFNWNSYYDETGNTLLEGQRIFRDISSLQASIKRKVPNQYGQIFTYQSISTGKIILLKDYKESERIPAIFGGDTFINRFGIKRKFPFFLTNRVGYPDKSDVAYDIMGNVAYPTYWISSYPKDIKLSNQTLLRANAVIREIQNMGKVGNILKNFTTGGAAGMVRFLNFGLALGKDIARNLGVKNINLDSYSEEEIYETGWFYLYNYGIPYFFVESDINVDYRQAGNSLDKDYYPNVGTDIPIFWLQEKNVSINFDNFYLYNRDFSKSNTEQFYYSLPRDFDPVRDQYIDHYTRTIYSQTSNLEENQNNWLVYKANDYYDFPLNNGRLIDINALEQEKVLTRFENNSAIYNAFVQIETDNKTAIVGTGSMFANPPQEFSNVEIGYLGTQHKAFVSSPYGYFWVDAKRGNVFHLGSGGSGIKELSRKGMKNWFRENLPFHIIKKFPEINIDDSFKDFGICMGWDNRYDRLFITKKDYIPKKDCIVYKDNEFYCREIETKLIEYEIKVCPDGYTYNAELNVCERISVIEPPLLFQNLVSKTDSLFGMYGMIVYEDDYQIDGAATISNTSNSDFWKNRTNSISKWLNLTGTPYDVWLGFNFCVDIDEEKTYFLGIGSDNGFQLVIDGIPVIVMDTTLTSNTVYNTSTAQNEFLTRQEFLGYQANVIPPPYTNSNIRDSAISLRCVTFLAYHIYPIVLSAGTHEIKILVENNDIGTPGMMACEIYDNVESDIINATQESDLNILFTTKDQTQFTTGDFECPEGYELIDAEPCDLPQCQKINTIDSGIQLVSELKEVETLTKISLDNKEYFDDASWTISYSPQTESWVSYHSFIPNYYIDHFNYFQTGHNDTSTLWDHLLTNKSYQVFYNKFYPFTVESITKPQPQQSILSSVAYKLDVLRYTNSVDQKLMKDITFDEALVYNSDQLSGILNLEISKKMDLSQFPTETNVFVSRIDDYWRFNKFYDLTKDKNSDESLFEYDGSNVHKIINPEAIDYDKLNQPFNRQRLKSDYFKVRLSNTKQSRYKYIYRWIINHIIKSIR